MMAMTDPHGAKDHAKPTAAMKADDDAKAFSSIVALIVCVCLIHSEQNLLAPNMSAVAESLGLNAVEKDEYLGGGLAVALFMVGGPAAMLVGVGADSASFRRVDLLCFVLLLGTAGCGGSALAVTYNQLFLARSLTGVSLGGALPLSFSLLGDLVGPAQRTAFSGRLGLAMHAGAACGQCLAGFIGPRLGWQCPFALVALLMLLLAAWVRAFMAEPPRRDLQQHRAPRRRQQDASTTSTLGGIASAVSHTCGAFVALLRVPTVRLIFLQGMPGCVPWGVIGAFLPDYLHKDVGYSVEGATAIISTFSLGGFLGVFLGGEGGQYLYNRVSPRAPAMLMLIAGSLGAVPMYTLVRFPPADAMAGCMLLAVCGGTLATVTGPIVRATLTNVTHGRQRGLAFASFALFDDVGKGAGPALISVLIQSFGRRWTFAAAMWLWVPCAVLNGLTAYTVAADEKQAARMAGGGGGRAGGARQPFADTCDEERATSSESTALMLDEDERTGYSD